MPELGSFGYAKNVVCLCPIKIHLIMLVMKKKTTDEQLIWQISGANCLRIKVMGRQIVLLLSRVIFFRDFAIFIGILMPVIGLFFVAA